MGKILVWVGADVTPTTGHQRFSAGNTPGDALAGMGWGWRANESQIRGFQEDLGWGELCNTISLLCHVSIV